MSHNFNHRVRELDASAVAHVVFGDSGSSGSSLAAAVAMPGATNILQGNQLERTQALPIHIAIVDAHWQIVATNAAWAWAATHYAYGALLGIGRSFKRFCEWSVMTGNDTAAAVLDGLRELDGSPLRNFAYISPTQDSVEGNYQVTIAPFEIDGEQFATISYVDLTELFGLREEWRAMSQDLLRAQSRVMQARDNERQRLARELHDSAGQYLTGMRLGLTHLRQVSSDPQVTEIADDITDQLDQFQSDVRALTFVLHPPALDRVGLHAALRSLCTGLAKRTGIEVSLRVHGTDPKLGSASESAVYRIVQESLSNIHRHAKARQVRVRLSDRPDALFLTVEDDGVGLDAERGATFQDPSRLGVGVPGMIARTQALGGRFVIRNRRSKAGTVMGAMIPRRGTLGSLPEFA